jgi:hypothetical protein
MNIGSYEYKKRFCQSLIDSHVPDNPDQLRWWPTLDASTIERLQGFSIWRNGLWAQHKGAQIVSAFAPTIKDPMAQAAVMLQAEEQVRLVKITQSFLSAYSIPSPVLAPVVIPKNLEAAFVKVGYQRSLDLFWADGLRAAAQKANVLPDALDQRFDQLLAEQTRHTIFLVNWMAYQKTKFNKRWSEWNAVPALWNRSGALVSLISAFGAKDVDERPAALRWMARYNMETFLTLCLSTQQKRMQTFDAELVQPQLSVNLAKLTREIFRVWPKRRVAPTVDILKP